MDNDQMESSWAEDSLRKRAERRAEKQRTWAEAAGREGGSEGYQFGDFTKTAIRSVWSFMTTKVDEQDENVDASERKRLALERHQQQKMEAKRQQELARLEKEKQNMEAFGQIVRLLVSGGNVTEEQIEMLWELSRSMTAQQVAEILARQLQILQDAGGDKVVEDSPGEKERFSLAIDSLIIGKGINEEQLRFMGESARKLTTETVTHTLGERLMAAWLKREAARKARDEALVAYKENFSQILASVTVSKTLDARMMRLLLEASSLLPKKDVDEILASNNTSWEVLIQMQSKEEQVQNASLAREIVQRRQGDKGWKPPPPPPRHHKGQQPPPPPPRPLRPVPSAPSTPSSVRPQPQSLSPSKSPHGDASAAPVSSSSMSPSKPPPPPPRRPSTVPSPESSSTSPPPPPPPKKSQGTGEEQSQPPVTVTQDPSPPPPMPLTPNRPSIPSSLLDALVTSKGELRHVDPEAEAACRPALPRARSMFGDLKERMDQMRALIVDAEDYEDENDSDSDWED